MKNFTLIGLIFLMAFTINAQETTININTTQNKTKVSPYIYGKNNSDAGEAELYKEAGLRIARLNQGNNATKYNWRKKISSHPDWYNNVYSRDWDAVSEYYVENCSDIPVMWAFQLLGRVASSTSYNFNDWAYNNSQWWQGINQNLAGGGTPNEANPSDDALKEGDVTLYTQEWPADSTVAILNHWFGNNGLGFNKNQFLYWNMDNEPGIWNGTHDDVMTDGLLPASDFMDKYIEVAKKAKAIFPEIKICGPVTTNEWQWYKWGDENINIDGKYYCWLEYFIKRCAEEEAVSGIRVLDVVDIHSYPYTTSETEALQFHRTYFDTDYTFPGANGVKTINGGWDNSQNKEYIFKRIKDWLNTYYEGNHGIKLGLSEWGPSTTDTDVTSVAYASMLGTFANHGVEYFMPWYWKTGMWETLHLFSKYSQEYSVSSISSNESMVSAYTTVNASSDSMTIIIVNRSQTAARTTTVNISGCSVNDGTYKTYQLANLPADETFVSHTDNALNGSEVPVNLNSFTITVPALSTTVIVVPTEVVVAIDKPKINNPEMILYPNPATNRVHIKLSSNVSQPEHIIVCDQTGRLVISQLFDLVDQPIELDVSSLNSGIYFLSVKNDNFIATKKVIVKK